MRSIKAIIISTVVLAAGCSNLDSMLGGRQRTAPPVGSLKYPAGQSNTRVTQINRAFGEVEARTQLSEIKDTLRRGDEKQFTLQERDATYEVYVGEFLKLPSAGVERFAVLNRSRDQYDSKNAGGFYYFRTIYQGPYDIKVDYINGTSKTIRVLNKMKYRFTEQDIYDIIKNSYNSGRYKDTLDFIDLSKMAYPQGARGSELNFLMLDLFMNTGNLGDAREKLTEIKRERSLSDRDMVKLFNSELALNPNYEVEDFYFNSSRYNSQLSEALAKYLSEKRNLTSKEAAFMGKDTVSANSSFFNTVFGAGGTDYSREEKGYQTISPPRELSQEASSVTKNSGSAEYESGKSAFDRKRYNEAIVLLNRAKRTGGAGEDLEFYLAESYFNIGNYEKAVENYNIYFRTQEDGIRMAESYYNCGIAYEKLGNKAGAESAFKKIIEKFPGTSWARKANIYIVRLKN